MSNTFITEANLAATAAAWDRRAARETILDPHGVSISRFEFATPYETDAGRVFDAVLVWYSATGAVEHVKCGLQGPIARETALLRALFFRRTSGS